EENRTTTSPGAARDATERPAPLPPTASGVPPIATRDAGAQRAQSSSATRPDPPASTTRPPADGSGRAPGDRTGEVNAGAIVGARPPDSRSTTGAASNGSAREVRNNDAPTTEPGNVESRAASTSPPV